MLHLAILTNTLAIWSNNYLNWTNIFCNVDKYIGNLDKQIFKLDKYFLQCGQPHFKLYSIGSKQKAKDKQRNTASFWQYECVVAIPFIKRYAGGLLGGWWASFHHVYISHRSVWSQFHLSSIGLLDSSGYKIVFLKPEDKITYSYYILYKLLYYGISVLVNQKNALVKIQTRV